MYMCLSVCRSPGGATKPLGIYYKAVNGSRDHLHTLKGKAGFRRISGFAVTMERSRAEGTAGFIINPVSESF